jgi:prepilin-type processing-associated H-X9-DG protein
MKLTPAGKLNRQIPLKNALVCALLNLKYMKPRFSNQRNHALTLVEVLIVIAILMVLAFFLLLSLTRGYNRFLRIECVSNLRQIGLDYRIWAGDNGGEYPMEILATNGTESGLADGRKAWVYYFVMSNALATPKLLHCPADKNRSAATNFSAEFNNRNVSYFVGLNADTNSPQAFLSGDDNFEISGVSIKSGLLEISSNTPIAWTTARHNRWGNIGLADGSVQQTTTSGLTNLFQQTGVATNHLAIP